MEHQVETVIQESRELRDLLELRAGEEAEATLDPEELLDHQDHQV